VSAYAGSVDVWDFSVAEEDEDNKGYEDVVSEIDMAGCLIVCEFAVLCILVRLDVSFIDHSIVPKMQICIIELVKSSLKHTHMEDN
jgi:hypothetical protein